MKSNHTRISVISQWKTFIRVLPTRRRRKPTATEITLLSPYAYLVFANLRSPIKKWSIIAVIDVRPMTAKYYDKIVYTNEHLYFQKIITNW